jgi:hypothetical protein
MAVQSTAMQLAVSWHLAIGQDELQGCFMISFEPRLSIATTKSGGFGGPARTWEAFVFLQATLEAVLVVFFEFTSHYFSPDRSAD